jgi:apolipoprotein N-acyltransferase
MLIPANDFEVDDWMSSRITALRGVEGGYAIARASRRGISSVSDHFGRLLAEQRSSETIATLAATVPVARPGATAYARIGDAFGWTCVAALAVTYWLLRRSRPARISP